MNYKRIYNQICERGQTRERDDNEYYEKHHIIPRCNGGSDDPENITYLTYREHVLCHWLLHRLHPSNKLLGLAYHSMVTLDRWGDRDNSGYTPSLRQLEEAKKAYIDYRTGTPHSEDTKRKISESNIGRDCPWRGSKLSKEHRDNMSKAKLGWNRSDDDKRKISEGKKQWYVNNSIDRDEWNDKQKQQHSEKVTLINSDEWGVVKERVYTKYMSGMSITRISKEEPVTRQAIYNWINDNGWTREATKATQS